LGTAQYAPQPIADAPQAFHVQPRHGTAIRFTFEGAADWTAADASGSIRVSVRTLLRADVGAISATAKRSNTNRRPMVPLLNTG